VTSYRFAPNQGPGPQRGAERIARHPMPPIARFGLRVSPVAMSRGMADRGISKANNEWSHVLMRLLGQHTLKTRTDMRGTRTASGFLGCQVSRPHNADERMAAVSADVAAEGAGTNTHAGLVLASSEVAALPRLRKGRRSESDQLLESCDRVDVGLNRRGNTGPVHGVHRDMAGAQFLPSDHVAPAVLDRRVNRRQTPCWELDIAIDPDRRRITARVQGEAA